MPQAELQPPKRIILPAYAPGTALPDMRGMKRHQLFKMLQAAVHNRVMIAVLLTELADRAERDTLLQEELHMIIPPPPLDNLEYVRPHTKYGTHTRGYWRTVRPNIIFPSIHQAEHRLEVSKYAYSIFGTKGVKVYPDGRQIPRAVHQIGERFRGVRYATEEELAERKRLKTVQRMAGEEPPVQPVQPVPLVQAQPQ